MIFYQYTTDTITKDMLIDAIQKTQSCTKTLHFCFNDFPTVNNLSSALEIIDQKRKTLLHSNDHTFLCIELALDTITISEELSIILDKFAKAINSFFQNDLFIISLIYLDETDIMHGLLCISDIERSLPDASEHYLYSEEIDKIFTETFPEFQMDYQSYKSLYLFQGASEQLPYTGVLHVDLFASPK